MARRSATVHIGQQKWRIRVCRVPADRLGDCNADTNPATPCDTGPATNFMPALMSTTVPFSPYPTRR